MVPPSIKPGRTLAESTHIAFGLHKRQGPSEVNKVLYKTRSDADGIEVASHAGVGGTRAGAPPARLRSSRGRRVTVLLLGVIVLSLADLVITLAFLRANWMMEANPIAAYIIRTTQSSWSLICFKCLTVLICAALLYRARHFRSGEVAAWSAVGVLAALSVMWHSYAAGIDEADIVLASANASTSTFDDGRLGLP